MCLTQKWQALHKLNKQFVSQIKLLCIFGQNANEVLVVTKVDQVFAFGDNVNGCLGLGTDQPAQEPIKVLELCNKSVLKFCCGLSHVIALLDTAILYSWGNNNFGQLGDGTTINRNKPRIIDSLIGQKFIEVSCGAHFTLALTESRDVFAFGHNCFGQLGCNSTYDQLIPIKINGFESEKVISLSCGFEHSAALTESGHVLTWGGNDLGQLGLGHREDQYIPTRVKHLDSVKVEKIVCGSAHNLLLSCDHDIYAFGCNFKGQIGSANYSNQDIPIKVNTSEKVTDIAAIFLNDISVALSLSGNCYVWGQVNSITEYIPIPKKVESKSIEDVFVDYALTKVPPKQIQIQ